MLGLHLKRFAESHGVPKTVEFFAEGLQTGRIAANQIHLKELAVALLGNRWDYVLQRRAGGLREAVEAVDSSGFAQITGQLLIQEIKSKYNAAEFIGDELCTLEPITNGNLGPQRTPWLSDVLDDGDQVQQGMPYPATSFSPNFIDAPAPAKFGRVCRLTFEMIFSDLTKQARDSAGSVGRRVRINKEERQLRVTYGLVNNHSWNGTTYNTYQASAPWANLVTGKIVNDWTDLNDLEIVFSKMLDPNTGKPIEISPNAALVSPYRYYNWKRIQSATNTRTGAFATSGNSPQTEAPNPLSSDYKILKSKYGYQQLTLASQGNLSDAQAREYVVFGDFKKAFAYREVYPMRTVEAPPQNPDEFHQDIVLSVKASEFGIMYVRDPRYVLLCYNN